TSHETRANRRPPLGWALTNCRSRVNYATGIPIIWRNSWLSTASNRLYCRLKKDIITGVLLPSRSFSEAEFANRYRVSRTPVREACRLLQNEGLITIIPFRGYFVASLTGLDFHNLEELQFVVDPAAAALAAQRPTVEQVRDMESYARYEYKVGTKASYYEFLQRNFKLHVGIAQATGNRELTAVVAN